MSSAPSVSSGRIRVSALVSPFSLRRPPDPGELQVEGLGGYFRFCLYLYPWSADRIQRQRNSVFAGRAAEHAVTTATA